MPTKDDDQIDYLLSRGSLGGSQRERILFAIHEGARFGESRPQRPSRRVRGGIVAGALLVVAAAGFLLYARPFSDTAEMRTKGGGGAASSLGVTCLNATLSACPRGSLLVFSVNGGDPGMFVTAYGDPRSGGTRIWYLNNEALAPAPAVSPITTPGTAASATGVLARAGRIGDEHASGPYRVRMLLTRRPIARDQAAALESTGEVVTRSEFDLVVPP